MTELRARRRWFWPMRYAGGVALAAALCGVVTVPVLLYAMRLAPGERRTVIVVGILSIILLPLAILTLSIARRFSVPASLHDMTGRGWECVRVRASPAVTTSAR